MKLVTALFVFWFCDRTCLTYGRDACESFQFACKNNKCIPLSWKCDEEDDCGDGSDEESCVQRTCRSNEFSCKNGKCVSVLWKCDGDDDCHDKSDEDPVMCAQKTCKPDEFSCGDRNCIPSTWVCDGQDDCDDGNDEKHCEIGTCSVNEIKCANGRCIESRWYCDQDNDCGDNSDEKNCKPVTCQSNEFKCGESTCIKNGWRCDGDFDCRDHSDEENCPTKSGHDCAATDFACTRSRECIHKSWKCDGDFDCTDESDEVDCVHTCEPDHFLCEGSKQCIHSILECDGLKDCVDGSDELRCPNSNVCTDDMFDCTGEKKTCISVEQVCDNRNDCGNWEDENKHTCNEKAPCQENNGGCLQICTNMHHTHRCDCFKGYKLVGNSSCEDIDECKIEGSCSQMCNNTKGGFKCGCLPGYTLVNHTFCKANGAQPWLIFANKRDVRRMQLGTHRFESIVLETSVAIALDFDYRRGLVYWTDLSLEQIARAPFHGNGNVNLEQKVIIYANLVTPDGICIDWIHQNMYWTDTGSDTIEVATVEGEHRKILIGTDLEEPRAIVVDPENGYMYWTDWGQDAKIEKCGMNGQHRRVIIRNVKWPNGLTIDYVTQRLYWIDAKLHSIESSNLEGGELRGILTSYSHIRHPFSITVFEDLLYWTDWTTESIRSVNKFTGKDSKDVAFGLRAAMDIHVYHQYRQPNSTNYCSHNNGGCPQLCLPAPQVHSGSPHYTCVCADGFDSFDDGRNCIKSNVTNTTVDRPSEQSTDSYDETDLTNTSLFNANFTVDNSTKKLTPSTKRQESDSTVKTTTWLSTSTRATNATTEKIVVDITTEAGGSYTIPSQSQGGMNQSTPVVTQKRQQDVGKIAGIVIGIVTLLVALIIGIGYVVYRSCRGRQTKHMNFDNPVYRKTTEDRIMLKKNLPTTKHLPSTLQPLTA